MKFVKKVCLVLSMSFLCLTPKVFPHKLVNTYKIIETLETIEPIFIYPKVYEKIRYSQLCLTTTNLTELYALLISKAKKQNKAISIQIKMVERLLTQIDTCIDQLNQSYFRDLDNHDGNNTNVINAQQTAIHNLMETIEQSNQTISQLTNKQSWQKIKIIGAVILGIVVGGILIYKTINSKFIEPVNQEIKKIEKKSGKIKDETKKIDDAMKITEVGKNTKEVLGSTEEITKTLVDIKEKSIVPLKKKIDERIRVINLLKAHEKDHGYIAEIIFGHRNMINYLKQRVEKQEKRIDELQMAGEKAVEEKNKEIEKINIKLREMSKVVDELSKEKS